MIWCLHGMLGHPTDWNSLSQHLASAGSVVRKVDLWRYLECRSITLSEFGEIFASEVRAQDTAPVLIGYSMGGRLALHALKAAPSLWKKAVLLGVHPGLQNNAQKQQRRMSDAEWGTLCLQLEWSEFLKKWNRQDIFQSEGLGSPQTTGLADRQLLQPRRHGVARSFVEWSLGKQDDLRPILKTLCCPIQLITGEEDQKFTPLAAEMKELLPEGEHQIISGAGHRTLWEKPTQTSSAILNFLRTQ